MAGEERSARPQNLILENRKRLSVSGVEEVSGFDDSYIRARTSLGDLIVRGQELHVETLSVETGELVITGQITELAYEDSALKNGLLSRLLR